jgi:purine catabolism regulator
VVVAETVTPGGRQGRGQARSRQRLREQLERDLVRCGCTALVGSEGDRVVGVAAVRADLVRAELDEGVTQPEARIGISELVDGDDLLRAYQHAVDAVEHAARRLPSGGAGAVVHFEDLGLSQLLTRLSDGPELARFVENELGPLVQHDRTHGANLLATLSAYLAENGSKTAAAKRLGVERRTVYYRLDRIGALLGRDLDDPEARLRLDVALRGWEVLQSLGGPQ